MTPLDFLFITLALTVLAAGVQFATRRRHVRRLRQLARDWDLHYSTADRFRLAARIAPKLPVPGAASVRVTDLLYGIEQENYRYLFCAEYTTGVLRTKTGVRRVATFSERRSAIGSNSNTMSEVVFAPEGLSVLEQYRKLHEQVKKG